MLRERSSLWRVWRIRSWGHDWPHSSDGWVRLIPTYSFGGNNIQNNRDWHLSSVDLLTLPVSLEQLAMISSGSWCAITLLFLLCWKFIKYVVFLGTLVDNKGKILVPGMYDHVAKLTDEEKKLYEKIEFDVEEYAKDVGTGKLLHDTKVNHRSLSIFSLSVDVIFMFRFI